MHTGNTQHVGLTERDIARGALLLAGTDFGITLVFAWVGAETHMEPWHPMIVVPAFSAAWLLFKFSTEITVFFAKAFRFFFGEKKATYTYRSTMSHFEDRMSGLINFAQNHHVRLATAVGSQSANALISFKEASSYVVTKSQFVLGIFVNAAYLLAYIAMVPVMFFIELFKYSRQAMHENYQVYKIQSQCFRYNKNYRFNKN